MTPMSSWFENCDFTLIFETQDPRGHFSETPIRPPTASEGQNKELGSVEAPGSPVIDSSLGRGALQPPPPDTDAPTQNEGE